MIRNNMEIVRGEDWYNGTTLWWVTYEYADAEGGGVRTDYFKTSNRYTPPTGPEIRRCLDGQRMTVIGIERIEAFTTELPTELPSEEAPPDAAHGRVFDLIADEPPSWPPLEFGYANSQFEAQLQAEAQFRSEASSRGGIVPGSFRVTVTLKTK